MNVVPRLVAAAAVGAIGACAVLVFHVADAQDARQLARLAQPAQDQLVQNVDLAQIASWRYVDDRHLEMRDREGSRYDMTFTAPCPATRGAPDISLVTAGHRDLDRFDAIVADGTICTFRDFSKRVVP